MIPEVMVPIGKFWVVWIIFLGEVIDGAFGTIMTIRARSLNNPPTIIPAGELATFVTHLLTPTSDTSKPLTARADSSCTLLTRNYSAFTAFITLFCT